MDNQEPARQPVQLGLLSTFILLVILFLGLVVYLSIENKNQYKPLSPEEGLRIDEIIEMGKQDLEHEDLLSQIRKDLKIPLGLEIKILVGPYLNIVSEGELIYSTNPFALVLILNETFYHDLTPDEKIALISHELGHLINEIIFHSYNPDTQILLQIEADTYATKYTSPEAMISVLSKANIRHGGFLSRQFYLRIENLKKIKQIQQAH